LWIIREIIKALEKDVWLNQTQICRKINNTNDCPQHYNPETGWMDRDCQSCKYNRSSVIYYLKKLKKAGRVEDSWVFYVEDCIPKTQKNLVQECFHVWRLKDGEEK